VQTYRDTQSAREDELATRAATEASANNASQEATIVLELESKLSEMTTKYIEMTALSTSWVETFEQKLAESQSVREQLETQLQESNSRESERVSALEQKLTEALSMRERVEKECRDLQARQVEIQQRAVGREALEQQLSAAQQQLAQAESALVTAKQQLTK
jgi:hypothetical protein